MTIFTLGVINALVLVACAWFVRGCYIWGTDSGECTSDSLNPLWRQANIPFCQNAILYPVCIPKYQPLPPSREYPNGRWTNLTVNSKDAWVQAVTLQHIAERIALERNTTLKKKRQNEYGDSGTIKQRFYKHADCQGAFKNLFCWINFPRCDPARDLTLPTCKSPCENFFKACGYERGLWRCGPSKYFNGYAPESPSYVNGSATYLRDYFPGQPFRKNKFGKGGRQSAICTPAIDGGASKIGSSWMLLTSFISLVAMLLCWL